MGSDEPKECCIRWVPDPHGRGSFKGERAAHCKVYGHSAVSCAEMAEPIEMLFGLWTQVDPRKQLLHGDLGCTLAPPGKCDSTVHVWRRCGLFCQILLTTYLWAPYVIGQVIYIVMSCMRVCRKQALARVKYYYY